MHLAHPLRVKAFEYRRVKNEWLDTEGVADLAAVGYRVGLPAEDKINQLASGVGVRVVRKIPQVQEEQSLDS